MAARTWAPGSAVCCRSPETAMRQETTTKQRALQTFAFRCFFSLLSEEKIPQDIRTYSGLMSSSGGRTSRRINALESSRITGDKLMPGSAATEEWVQTLAERHRHGGNT